MRLIPGFSEPKMSKPLPPPPPPARDAGALDEARRQERERERARRGRAATILSGEQRDDPLGAVSRPQARAAKLLGD